MVVCKDQWVEHSGQVRPEQGTDGVNGQIDVCGQVGLLTISDVHTAAAPFSLKMHFQFGWHGAGYAHHEHRRCSGK